MSSVQVSLQVPRLAAVTSPGTTRGRPGARLLGNGVRRGGEPAKKFNQFHLTKKITKLTVELMMKNFAFLDGMRCEKSMELECGPESVVLVIPRTT